MSSSSPPGPVQADVGALYLRYREAMYRVARAEVGRRREHLVDDVVSDVVKDLLRAHRDGTLAAPESWEAYLVVAVRRRARRLGARDAERDPVEALPSGRNGPVAPSEPSHDPLDTTADLLALHAGLSRLPDEQRQLVVQVFWMNATLTQLSPRYGVTRQALGQRLTQALTALRKELDDDDRPR